MKAQVITISGTGPLAGNQAFGGSSFGTDFDINLPVNVTALGYFDSNQDGLNAGTTISVEIWGRNNNDTPDDPSDDTAGSLISTLSFNSSDPGTLKPASDGVYRFANLASSMELPVGSYTITAAGFIGNDTALNRGFDLAGLPAPILNESNSTIKFVGTGRYGVAGAGVWPTIVDGGPAARYFASSFIIDAPIVEPFLRLSIDRETGAMNILNDTGDTVQMFGYSIQIPSENLNEQSWLSITDNYDSDAPSPNGGTVDSDDVWNILSQPDSKKDFSEFEFGNGDGAFLFAGQSVDLGTGLWKKFFDENITFEYTTTDGIKVNGIVEFTGNNGSPYKFGDLNFDGTPFGLDDFTDVMLPNLISETPGLSPYEAYLVGDLDEDGDVDTMDFRIFKDGYLQGGGSLDTLQNAMQVPEPSSIVMLIVVSGLLLCLFPKRIGQKHGVMTIAMLLAIGFSSTAKAQINALESDFPLSGNQFFNGELGMDFVISEFSVIVDSMGVFDADQDGILGETTSIHVEIWERDDNGTPNNPADDTGISLVAGTQTIFTSSDSGTLSGASRFKSITPITLPPGNYTIVAGGYTDDELASNVAIFDGTPEPTVNGSTGVIEFVGSSRFDAIFAPGNFPAFADGNNIPTQYNAGTFSYSVDIEPLTLEVNTTTGNVAIKNTGSDTFDFDIYQIQSESGSLVESGWVSLQDSSVTGWLEAGVVDEFELTEFNLTNMSTFTPSDLQSLGTVFDKDNGSQDIIFKYTTVSGIEVEGMVEYVTSSENADFDQDGDVDGTDFLAWQVGFGSAGMQANGDANGDGQVDATDFGIWQNQFGTTIGEGSLANGSVPEPSSVVLLGFVAILSSVFAQRKLRK